MKRVATVLMAFVLLLSSLFILVNATDDASEDELFKNGGFEESFSIILPPLAAVYYDFKEDVKDKE